MNTRSAGYIPTLDGWRAIAVLSVILFHDSVHSIGSLSTSWLHNYGEKGVDIFFAISGLLICSRLLQEERLAGRISLRNFYIRRAFRILPAAIIFLLAVGLLSLLGIIAVGGRQWLGAAFFFRNYTGLLGPVATSHDYTEHFWSLCVEEHFYLLLPGLLVFTRRRLRLPIFVGLAILLLVHQILVLTKRPWSHVLHHTDIRLFSLLFAALVAIVMQSLEDESRSGVARVLKLWPALLALTCFLFVPAQQTRWWDTAVIAGSLPLVVLGSALNSRSFCARALEWAPLRYLGRISYGLYLWQQLFFTERLHPAIRELGPLQGLPWRFVATFACAAASYHFLERRMLRWGQVLAAPVVSRRNDMETASASEPGRMLRRIPLMPLVVLGAAALVQILLWPKAWAQQELRPPIPIRFHLEKAAFVTLVIEDEQGRRVRNLVSETHFGAGDNVVWWDGLDDLERDRSSGQHGVYYIPGKFVTHGNYIVRGLYRQQIDLKYEFAVYNPGQPPWETPDRSSAWLTSHTPPGAICFIPAGVVPVHGKHDVGSPAQVMVGSFVAEGGSGLAWLDLDGHKLHGQQWVGGLWTGAEQLAREMGSHPQPGVYAYVAAAVDGELRLHKFGNEKKDEQKRPRDPRLGSGEDSPVLSANWRFPKPELEGVAGLAAYNGLLFVSLPKMDSLLLVDAIGSRIVGTLPIAKPSGVFVNSQGNLFVISNQAILQFKIRDKVASTLDLGNPTIVFTADLEDPQAITMDSAKNFYVSDWGTSNQVKVFSPSGKLLRTIGTPGVVASGPYNPLLMHRPKGIAIDSRNQLWVAEEDFQPKRISVWSLDGHMQRAFYGPPTYGGGGNLDSKDKTLFYLDGMTFRLNWDTGESQLIAIHHRTTGAEPPLVPIFPESHKAPRFQEPGSRYKKFGASENPDLPIYFGGRKYFTNAYNSDPLSGTPVAGLWIDRNGVAVPVAAFGNAIYWPALKDSGFRSRFGAAANLNNSKEPDLSKYFFVWSDLNGDGAVEPSEVTIVPRALRTVTVSTSLEFVTDTALSYKPVSFTAKGAPVYDPSQGTQLCPETQRPTSSGGGQVLTTKTDWTILTTAPKPFASESLGGAEQGVARWSYPSLWPGLHASHIAPTPEFPGELIGTTRLLGPSFRVKKDGDIELWAINGNKGTVYLFTTDGLFVATLFKDTRLPNSSWAQRDNATRGMTISDLTTGEENFWPSITQTEDGRVYVVTNFPGIVRVDGLDTIRPIAPWTIHVTTEMLEEARDYFENVGLSRQQAAHASGLLVVPVSGAAFALDPNLSNWDPKQFVTIDERSQLVGNWGRSNTRITAALKIGGNRLYAAFQIDDPKALDNAGTSLQNLFKTGGALDLMLGTNPSSDPQRKSAADGDVRLLVSIVKGKPVAVLYRQVAREGPKLPVLFESPVRRLKFDDVEDVTRDLQLATSGIKAPANLPAASRFVFSIPLEVLGLKPTPGITLRGDVGLLRGDGLRTTQRVYWSNKATGLVSDVPSEAELTPQLWGEVRLVTDSGISYAQDSDSGKRRVERQ